MPDPQGMVDIVAKTEVCDEIREAIRRIGSTNIQICIECGYIFPASFEDYGDPLEQNASAPVSLGDASSLELAEELHPGISEDVSTRDPLGKIKVCVAKRRTYAYTMDIMAAVAMVRRRIGVLCGSRVVLSGPSRAHLNSCILSSAQSSGASVCGLLHVDFVQQQSITHQHADHYRLARTTLPHFQIQHALAEVGYLTPTHWSAGNQRFGLGMSPALHMLQRAVAEGPQLPMFLFFYQQCRPSDMRQRALNSDIVIRSGDTREVFTAEEVRQRARVERKGLLRRLAALKSQSPADYALLKTDIGAQFGTRCENCDSLGKKLSYCAACGMAAYCSRECQQQDWKAHKPDCLKGRSQGGM